LFRSFVFLVIWEFLFPIYNINITFFSPLCSVLQWHHWRVWNVPWTFLLSLLRSVPLRVTMMMDKAPEHCKMFSGPLFFPRSPAPLHSAPLCSVLQWHHWWVWNVPWTFLLSLLRSVPLRVTLMKNNVLHCKMCYIVKCSLDLSSISAPFCSVLHCKMCYIVKCSLVWNNKFFYKI
jgi:hypothetical protein